MALFPEQFNQASGQRVNGPVSVDLVAGSPSVLIAANVARCFLLVCVPVGSQIVIYPSASPASGTGIVVGTVPNFISLSYREFGIFVMTRWLAESIGGPVTVACWEVVSLQ